MQKWALLHNLQQEGIFSIKCFRTNNSNNKTQDWYLHCQERAEENTARTVEAEKNVAQPAEAEKIDARPAEKQWKCCSARQKWGDRCPAAEIEENVAEPAKEDAQPP